MKILMDDDVGLVNFTPIPTTVSELSAIPIHEVPYPQRARITPEELQTYRIQARLLEVIPEDDQDLHVIVADPVTGQTMIVEIPDPNCAIGSGHEEEYGAARTAIRTLEPGSLVEIVGVGFFDFIHNQRARVPNGIELHPVLSISILGDQGFPGWRLPPAG